MPDFPLWPQCNLGCVFCSNPVDGYRRTSDHYSFDAIRRKIEDYKRGERTFLKFDDVSDYFNLTGGEPTLHPQFARILALLRVEFPETLIRLLTNGRTLSDSGFARRICGIGGPNFEIAVPIFGGDARSHEATSRTPGSFEQTVQGLRNVREFRRAGQALEIRVIMTRIQVKFLSGLLDFLLKEFSWIDRIVFLYEELEGFAELYSDRLKISQSECARALDSMHDKLAGFKDARLYHFSLCTVPTRLWPRVWNTLAPFKVTWKEECRLQCAHRRDCLGIHRSYLKHSEASDIAPIRSPRAAIRSGNRYHPFLSEPAHEPLA